MFGRRTTSRGEEPGSGLGTGWWAAAALMAVVVIALVAVLVVVGTRDKSVAAGDPATATAAPSALPAPVGGGGSTSAPAAPTVPGGDNRPAGCATTATDQTIPGDTPKDVTWTLVAGIAVPQSSTAGPMLHSPAGVSYCYARTPVGVVLAVSNLGRAVGDAAALQTDSVKYSIVPGPLTDALAAQPPVTSDPASLSGVQYAGFRIISYTQDSASVAIALSSPSSPGSYIVGTAAMEWNQGDWRVVVQPGPSILATATSTTSLASFVPWSGVS
jgi:hypothetical protein